MKTKDGIFELLCQLDWCDKMINAPFAYTPGNLAYRENEQRESQARNQEHWRTEFDKAATALVQIHLKRHRRKMAANARRFDSQRPPVNTSAEVVPIYKFPAIGLEAQAEPDI